MNQVYFHVVLTEPTGYKAYPYCVIHGAMLCVNKEGTLYRCPSCHAGYDTKLRVEL